MLLQFEANVKFRPISTNELDVCEVYSCLLPKLELYYLNHIYFHVLVFLNNKEELFLKVCFFYSEFNK